MDKGNRLNMDEMGDKIQSFKTDINFPTIDPPNNITDIITKVSSGALIRNLSSMELMEYATILSSYSLYLSIQENRLDSLCGWCDSNIKFIVGKTVKDVEAYSFAEKDAYIRAHETNAVELHDQLLEHKAKKESIKFIAHKMHNLAEHLRGMASEKSKEKRYSNAY